MGSSYDAFLLNALGYTGRGARDLDQAPIQVLVRLSVGTGIPLNRLREMFTQRVMRRMGQWPEESSEPARNRSALDCLCAMGSRRRRRMSANRGF